MAFGELRDAFCSFAFLAIEIEYKSASLKAAGVVDSTVLLKGRGTQARVPGSHDGPWQAPSTTLAYSITIIFGMQWTGEGEGECGGKMRAK